MTGAKECTTPMSSSQSLQLNDGSAPTDATQYRQVIGALEYLSLTRSDVSFVVNKDRFMHAPTVIHWSIVCKTDIYIYISATQVHVSQSSNKVFE